MFNIKYSQHINNMQRMVETRGCSMEKLLSMNICA